MTVDRKTLNAIKNHLLSKKQIVLGSFSNADIEYIVNQLRQEGLHISIQGNKVILEQAEAPNRVQEEIKPEIKEAKVETPKEEQKPKEEVKQKEEQKPKEEVKQKQKKSTAIHIRLPTEYVNYINTVNANTTYALKLIIFEHAKAKGVSLPEPKVQNSSITKKDKKMLKQCLDLQTKEEILQCLQQKLVK